MSKEFFDRLNELNLLKEKYEKMKSGEMLVVYGRRRVGKTELIKEFMKSLDREKRLYFYVDLVSEKQVLDSFSSSIQEQLGETFRFESFESVFKYLEEKSSKGKFLLVIDEFQRFLDIAPGFITQLQNQWDSGLKNNRLMIILVGSSIGMIQKITESRAGALYGRVSKVKISPFRYADFRLMFRDIEETQKIIRYAVFGGTPYYLSKTKDIHDVSQAILDLVLKKGGELYEEPKNLLEYENVRVHATYNSILYSIASGKEILNEIGGFVKIPATTITAYLRRLDDLLDLVGKRDPIFGKERLGRYAIRDNFFKFWYKFVFPNQTAINLGNVKLVYDNIKQNLNSYIGRIFEDVVKELLILYQNKKIKNAEINFEDIGSWWDRNGNEIDIVAYNKKEKKILVGEVKWTNEPVDIDVLNELIRKSKFLNFEGKYQYFIASKSGFTERCFNEMKSINALHLDINDISKLFDNA